MEFYTFLPQRLTRLDKNCSQEKNNRRIAGLRKCVTESNSGHNKNRADSLDDSIQLCLYTMEKEQAVGEQ